MRPARATMAGLKIGYARLHRPVELTAQREGLPSLGVPAERIDVGHGTQGHQLGAARSARKPSQDAAPDEALCGLSASPSQQARSEAPEGLVGGSTHG